MSMLISVRLFFIRDFILKFYYTAKNAGYEGMIPNQFSSVLFYIEYLKKERRKNYGISKNIT